MNSPQFQERLLDLQSNLLNFAYMLTSDREEAHDLLQDTTLKALDNEDKYIDNVNFKGTAWGIINAYADYITHKPVKNTKNADENKFEMVTFAPYFNQILSVLNMYAY